MILFFFLADKTFCVSHLFNVACIGAISWFMISLSISFMSIWCFYAPFTLLINLSQNLCFLIIKFDAFWYFLMSFKGFWCHPSAWLFLNFLIIYAFKFVGVFWWHLFHWLFLNFFLMVSFLILFKTLSPWLFLNFELAPLSSSSPATWFSLEKLKTWLIWKPMVF